MEGRLYHIGFGRADLPDGTTTVLLSGDPGALRADRHRAPRRRAAAGAQPRPRLFVATLPGGAPVVCATSGMGAPSMSIVVNELVQAGIRTIIRVGTSGSIQDHVRVGSVVIGSGALTNQGAADDIAPPEFPAVADPFLTVTLATAAAELGVDHHVGVMASVGHVLRGPGALGVVGQPAPAAAPARDDRRVPRPRHPQLRDGGRHAVQDGRRLRLRRRLRVRHHRPARRGRGAARTTRRTPPSTGRSVSPSRPPTAWSDADSDLEKPAIRAPNA